MKRLLSLKNSIMVTSGLIGLLFTASSFSFGPVDAALLTGDPPQKKEQRVKVVVNRDGKQIKIDTTFNLPDEKMVQLKVDSMLKHLDLGGFTSGGSDIVIHRGGKRLSFNHSEGSNFPGNEEIDINIQHGDSGKMRNERRIIHIRGNENDELIAPLPPPPPHAPVMMIRKRLGGDSFAFDPNDESVISYDKKDIGKGLEKITIIRKKQADRDVKKEVNAKVTRKAEKR